MWFQRESSNWKGMHERSHQSRKLSAHISITQKMQIASWKLDRAINFQGLSQGHTSYSNSVPPKGSIAFPSITINSGPSLQVPKYFVTISSSKCQFSHLSWQIRLTDWSMLSENEKFFYFTEINIFLYFKHPWEWVFVPSNYCKFQKEFIFCLKFEVYFYVDTAPLTYILPIFCLAFSHHIYSIISPIPSLKPSIFSFSYMPFYFLACYHLCLPHKCIYWN